MANTRKARNQGQNQAHTEAPVDFEIRRAAERIGYEADSSHAKAARALRQLLGGGLIVADYADSGAEFPDRLRATVLAQLTMLNVFLAVAGWADQGPDNCPVDFKDMDYLETGTLALSATIALLENAPDLVRYLDRSDSVPAVTP
jgi:hypothetical protein